MPSSRKSLRAETQLKASDWRGFGAEFERESDRAVAVLAAAMVDEWLRRLLAAFMIDDSRRVESLLEVDQPIGSLGARIRLAYCLGLIDDEALEMLGSIKNVRNAFAHQLHGLAFTHPVISNECEKLRELKTLFSNLPDSPRLVFVVATFSSLMKIQSRTASLERTGQRCVVPALRASTKPLSGRQP